MADPALKQKIRDTLKRKAFNAPDDVVDVSDGELEDLVHVVVISRQFDGRGLSQRTDLLCTEMERYLTPDERGHVILAAGVSPSQVNGATIEKLKTI